jgi:hypothetical protein
MKFQTTSEQKCSKLVFSKISVGIDLLVHTALQPGLPGDRFLTGMAGFSILRPVAGFLCGMPVFSQ